MKKTMVFSLIIIFTITLSGCSLPKFFNSSDSNIHGNYVSGSYEDNYVWGGAISLAWNDLNENILHEKLKLNSKDKEVLNMVEKFNNSPFSKKDLDDESFYIKSGYGQETIDLINKESKEKFPSKSFGDLDSNLGPKDIIAFAYFLKEVEYLTQFSEKDVSFNKDKVKGFHADGSGERGNIEILKYWNDNKFIISLRLKDNNDELIIAKGFNMDNPENIVTEMNKHNSTSELSYGDKFEMPKLHFEYEREYSDLIGKFLSNDNFTDYFIASMQQKIKFDMDHKGARVEDLLSLTSTFSSVPPEEENPKLLILDKPFWIVMKRTDSDNPYFILGVNNTNVMDKVEN